MTARRDIDNRILALLALRTPDASICPSEVARALNEHEWRTLMPAVREAAADLASKGLVRVTQHEYELARDAITTARGPIRLRRGSEFDRG